MGVASEDVVMVQLGKKPGEPSVVTVNCPDKTGLGCDLCRTILEFGLRITRGDISTDGNWCYVVLWVLPRYSSVNVRWDSLKSRLLSLCPSCSISPYYSFLTKKPTESPLYLLKLFCIDCKGLLHDVTNVLCELELLIHRVKVSTTPDGKVVDFFFITDGRELMHTKKRQEETSSLLTAVLGESCEHCELQLAGAEFESYRHSFSSYSSAVFDELFSPEMPGNAACLQTMDPDLTKMKKASINIDNSLSPGHTLLQIHCADQKGLLYDILRTLKDCNIKTCYGRLMSDIKGVTRDVDLFIQQNDGKKVVDPEKQDALCSRLRMEMLHPLRVLIINRGPDTELLVANPVELCGKGRPRVFYDVTLALKVLGICIFSAEIGRHSTPERQWEVYSFLLDESTEFPPANTKARSQIVDTVRKTLMGW